MSWFIFSEVMFFAAFFGALFYARVLSVPGLGDLEQQACCGPTSRRTGRPPGRPSAEPFTPMGAWGIPAINTLLLLSSGVTVTWAHWALKENNRGQLIWGWSLTIALGVMFLGLPGVRVHPRLQRPQPQAHTGVYGSTFFMLTGFHGFHVTVGAIMLTVILGSAASPGHFKPDHHFAFEGVSWYWHFVDVVWLLLFVLVYWL